MFFLLACVESGLNHAKSGGLYQPDIVVSPDHLDFGLVPLSSSASQTLTVQNQGDSNLTISQVTASGVGASSFTLLGAPEDRSISPGEQLSFEVVYSATQSVDAASVVIQNDDPETPSVVVPLTATVSMSDLQIDPNPVDFGNTVVGATVQKSATLRNVGDAPVQISALVTDGAPYQLLSSAPLPLVLHANESSSVDLLFSPTADDVFWGYLWVTSDDVAGFHAVPLIGSTSLPNNEDPQEDTGTAPDPCYQEDQGFDTHAGATFVTTENTSVEVTYMGTDAGYSSELVMVSPDSVHIATGHSDSAGKTKTLGPYWAGIEIVFGIHVQDTGDDWQNGPGNRNSDGKVHAAITYVGQCTWTIGFEDLDGGGDRDYNDILMRVHGSLKESL